MVTRLPITKARINLGQVARRAHVDKEYFILEKDGIPMAGIMDAGEMEDYLELANPSIRQFISEGVASYLSGQTVGAGEVLARLKRAAGKPASSKRRLPA